MNNTRTIDVQCLSRSYNDRFTNVMPENILHQMCNVSHLTVNQKTIRPIKQCAVRLKSKGHKFRDPDPDPESGFP